MKNTKENSYTPRKKMKLVVEDKKWQAHENAKLHIWLKICGDWSCGVIHPNVQFLFQILIIMYGRRQERHNIVYTHL